MYVIGVAGQAQMGKDTLADELHILLNECGGVQWTRAAFASNVKRVFMETFDVDADFVEKWKVITENPPDFDMPVRQALQFIGDGFRKIKSTVWLDIPFRDNVPKIISDVRYINEFCRVKKEGGMNILVGRPDKLNDDPNGSEAQIRPYVVWCLKALCFESADVIDLRNFDFEHERLTYPVGHELHPPEHMENFDFFVRNAHPTKEDFYERIEIELLDLVKEFTYQFPELSLKKEDNALH